MFSVKYVIRKVFPMYNLFLTLPAVDVCSNLTEFLALWDIADVLILHMDLFRTSMSVARPVIWKYIKSTEKLYEIKCIS